MVTRKARPVLHNFLSMKLIGIDPGASWTGVSVLNISWPKGKDLQINHEWRQLGPDDHHHALWAYLHICGPLDAIIQERFEHRNNEFAELGSLEYIGVTKLFSQQKKIPLVMQGASQAKEFATDDKLERLDLLLHPLHPLRHANDGSRHLVYYLCANAQYTRAIPPRLRLELLRRLK